MAAVSHHILVSNVFSDRWLDVQMDGRASEGARQRADGRTGVRADERPDQRGAPGERTGGQPVARTGGHWDGRVPSVGDDGPDRPRSLGIRSSVANLIPRVRSHLYGLGRFFFCCFGTFLEKEHIGCQQDSFMMACRNSGTNIHVRTSSDIL